MRRTKLEKETIINFNEAEDTAQIYTFNAALKQRLFSFSRQHPELCQLVRKSEDGSVTYHVEKFRLQSDSYRRSLKTSVKNARRT